MTIELLETGYAKAVSQADNVYAVGGGEGATLSLSVSLPQILPFCHGVVAYVVHCGTHICLQPIYCNTTASSSYNADRQQMVNRCAIASSRLSMPRLLAFDTSCADGCANGIET